MTAHPAPSNGGFFIRIPLRIHSVANLREHWAVRAKRAKTEKAAMVVVPRGLPLPCTVTLTRYGPRPLDGDNLQGGCKAVRDGIAMRLGVDDADPRVTWRYEQAKGPYGLGISIV